MSFYVKLVNMAEIVVSINIFQLYIRQGRGNSGFLNKSMKNHKSKQHKFWGEKKN